MGIFDVGSRDLQVVNIGFHDSRLVTEFLVTWKSSIIEHQLHESSRIVDILYPNYSMLARWLQVS